MRRLSGPLLILALSIFIAFHIFFLWKGTHVYQRAASKEELIRATTLIPSCPDPFYRLGLYYQWNIVNYDLQASIEYLRKAVTRNPLDQGTWFGLAKAFQRTGQREAFEQSLRRAVSVSPASFQGRWMAGTLLLQQGEMSRAIEHFSYLLSAYPGKSSTVFDVLVSVTRDIDWILDQVVSGSPALIHQFLAHLYSMGDPEGAIKVWARKASLGIRSDRMETLRQVDFLLSHRLIHEAFRVWEARLREEGLAARSGLNLMTNGGFEQEKVLGGGFDWKMLPVPGANTSFDPSVAFEGKRSLKISFNGKENVDFHHIFQYVSWRPNADYLLRVRVRTKEVTTKSGVKIEVIGIGGAGNTGPSLLASSESLTGDNGWKELTVAFRTPDRSQGGMVQVRREKTDKFDRLLSGTVWLDIFELKEK